MRRLILLPLILLAMAADAHELRPTIVDVTLSRDGGYVLTLQANVEALIAGIGPEHDNTENAPEAERYNQLRALPPSTLVEQFDAFLPELRAGFELTADGTALTPEFERIEIPETGDTELARDSQVEFEGQLPGGTQSLRWQWTGEFGANALRVTGPGGEDLHSAYLQDGQRSASIDVSDVIGGPSFGISLFAGAAISLLLAGGMIAWVRSH